MDCRGRMGVVGCPELALRGEVERRVATGSDLGARRDVDGGEGRRALGRGAEDGAAGEKKERVLTAAARADEAAHRGDEGRCEDAEVAGEAQAPVAALAKDPGAALEVQDQRVLAAAVDARGPGLVGPKVLDGQRDHGPERPARAALADAVRAQPEHLAPGAEQQRVPGAARERHDADLPTLAKATAPHGRATPLFRTREEHVS